jgi:hypothetical protein
MYSIHRKPLPTPASSSRTLLSQSSVSDFAQDARLLASQVDSRRSCSPSDDESNIAYQVSAPGSHPQRLGLPSQEIDTNAPENHRYLGTGWPQYPSRPRPKHQFELITESGEHHWLLTTKTQGRKFSFSPNLTFMGFRRALHRSYKHLGWWKTCIVALGTFFILMLLCWLLFLWHNIC